MQRQTGGSGGGANNSYYALDTAMFDGYGAKLGDTDAFTGGAEPTRDAMGFQGQFGAYTDNETGLVLMGHRYYDAGTGRFLTRDPKGYGGGINLYGFTGNNPVNESDPSGFDPLLSGQDLKEGLGTGWAGFSTAVWNTPGLGNINRKYNIYSAGDYANQPGFSTSVTLGTVGIAVLPIPIGGKITIAVRAANSLRLVRAAYLAETGDRIRRSIPTAYGIVEATAKVSSKGSTLILEDINIAERNNRLIPRGVVQKEMFKLTRTVMRQAKQGGFKYIRIKAFRMPGQTVNPFRDVDQVIKLR